MFPYLTKMILLLLKKKYKIHHKKYGFNLNKVAELNEKSPKDKLPRIIDKLYYLGLYYDSIFKILYESYRRK